MASNATTSIVKLSHCSCCNGCRLESNFWVEPTKLSQACLAATNAFSSLFKLVLICVFRIRGISYLHVWGNRQEQQRKGGACSQEDLHILSRLLVTCNRYGCTTRFSCIFFVIWHCALRFTWDESESGISNHDFFYFYYDSNPCLKKQIKIIICLMCV